MANNYTKGAWKVYPTNHQGVNLKIATGEAEQGIAYLSKDLVEYQANANLIAAAPDMYEALKLILSLGLNDGRRWMAEQALAKAESS